ncbi:MAG: hypothetical protein M3N18_13695 [Actinomycetota bacterium]|nr:hypothetical protein [Actinomycetota bacterium]
MAERRGAEDMAVAAQRMAEAAERMADAGARIQGFASESEPLAEEEVNRFALATVHRAREEPERTTERAPAPTPEEIKSWVARGKELQDTESGGDL